jgi:hypothetical protein
MTKHPLLEKMETEQQTTTKTTEQKIPIVKTLIILLFTIWLSLTVLSNIMSLVLPITLDNAITFLVITQITSYVFIALMFFIVWEIAK